MCLGPIGKGETCVRFSVFDGMHAAGANMCMVCVYDIYQFGKMNPERKAQNKAENRKPKKPITHGPNIKI